MALVVLGATRCRVVARIGDVSTFLNKEGELGRAEATLAAAYTNIFVHCLFCGE